MRILNTGFDCLKMLIMFSVNSKVKKCKLSEQWRKYSSSILAADLWKVEQESQIPGLV